MTKADQVERDRTAPQAPARPHAQLQRRGVERFNAILDAAEQVLRTDGYEAATLKAVGELAGIPTASVYHYFADRHQVDAELLRRHFTNITQLVSAEFQGNDAPRTVDELVSVIVYPMLAYFREHPDCVELWFARRNKPNEDLVRSFDDALAEEAWRFAVDRGLLRSDTSLFVVRMAFEVGSHLFDVAYRVAPASGDDAVLAEGCHLVGSYLKTYAPDASTS